MVESNDYIKNYTNGYLASRLITLDVFNKKYELIDYDYVDEYKNLYHSSGDGALAKPLFDIEGARSPASSVSFYPVNPRLFQTSQTDYFKDNKPCRTTIEIKSLPTPIAIELKIIATIKT